MTSSEGLDNITSTIQQKYTSHQKGVSLSVYVQVFLWKSNKSIASFSDSKKCHWINHRIGDCTSAEKSEKYANFVIINLQIRKVRAICRIVSLSLKFRMCTRIGRGGAPAGNGLVGSLSALSTAYRRQTIFTNDMCETLLEEIKRVLTNERKFITPQPIFKIIHLIHQCSDMLCVILDLLYQRLDGIFHSTNSFLSRRQPLTHL